MAKINKIIILLFVFGFFYTFIPNHLVFAGEMPDWTINFIWNNTVVNNGGQYDFPLNTIGSASWFWPAGNWAFGEVYKGTLHNSTQVMGHSLGNSGQLFYQNDQWPDYGHYFVVVHIVSPWEDFSPVISWFENGTGYSPDHWGMIEFDVGEGSLSQKAASLAKQVVNHPEAYLLGGKGWDYSLKKFITASNLLAGYTYKKGITGKGVDCSGLIMWAYDRSFDSNKPASDNFVSALTANEQYIHNTTPVVESDLQPGDVMFFDWNSDDRIDHTAMYVGESGGYDVVSAVNPTLGIAPRSKDLLKNADGFLTFKRVSTADPLAMVITSHSPVDLIVTDPDGFTITPTTIVPSDEEYIREVSDILYYSEMEQGPDGNPIDRVYSYTPKTGNYKIQVIPDSDAPVDATYSLDFTAKNQTVTLAQNVPIGQIPFGGYDVKVNEDNTISTIKTFTPSADTYVKLENPNKNQNTENKLNLQYFDAHRILVQFNQQEIQSAIPAGSTIVSAKLEFTITKNGNTWGKNGNSIGLYKMTKPWTESGATWFCANDMNTSNSKPDCPTTLWNMTGLTKLIPFITTSIDTQTITNNQSGIISFDVTNDIKKFLSGETQNYGWLIKKTNLLSTGWIEFGSRESTNAPKLIIETK